MARVETEPTVLRLSELDAQAVVVVRSAEAVDRRGQLLTFEERRQAAQTSGESRAGDKASEDDPLWWSRRAQTLLPLLESRIPHLGRLLSWSRPARGWTVPVLLLALIAGLGTQALGPEKRVSLLALPLFALLAWNVFSLLFLSLRRLLPLGRLGRTLGERITSWWSERLEAQVERLARRNERADDPDEKASVAARALRHYLRAWLPTVTPLALARLGRLLHGGAWMMVAGAVAGMYLRGLVWEYRVTWESTFLGAATLDALLGTILAPAAMVLGSEVPSVVGLQSPGSGDAAPWIHLWATTAALFVGLPRALAWSVAHWRASRLARSLPVVLDESYRRRLRSARDLTSHRVEVIPYSHQPSQKSFAVLEGLLHDLVGIRSEIRRQPPVAYGEPIPGSFDGRLRALLFNLAQTPELEVHGEWIAAVRDDLVDGQALLALVDAAPYRRRLGESEPQRLAERQRSWQRVLAGSGIEAVCLDLESEPDTVPLDRLAAGVWPEGALDARA